MRLFDFSLLISKEPFQVPLTLSTVFVCRRQPTEEPAVPSELGLDLFREATLRGGRKGQVPGGGAETARLPGGDLLR